MSTEVKEKKTRIRKPAPITKAQIDALELGELLDLKYDIEERVAAEKEKRQKELELIG